MEYGENNNSYFLGLGKQRQIKKSINKLIDENNDIITDQMHILSTMSRGCGLFHCVMGGYVERLWSLSLCFGRLC